MGFFTVYLQDLYLASHFTTTSKTLGSIIFLCGDLIGCLSLSSLFGTPGTEPLRIKYSPLTSPKCLKPPEGLITTPSLPPVSLFLSPVFEIIKILLLYSVL